MGLYTQNIEEVSKDKPKEVKKKGRPKKVVVEEPVEPEVVKIEEPVKEEPLVAEKALSQPHPEKLEPPPQKPLVLVEEKKASTPKRPRNSRSPKEKVSVNDEESNEKKTKRVKTTKSPKPSAPEKPPKWFTEYLENERKESAKPKKKTSVTSQMATKIWNERRPKTGDTDSFGDKLFNQMFGR